MTLKQLLTIVVTATILCWLIWIVVLLQIDPEANGFWGVFLFFTSLFFSLLGTFFISAFAWRKIFNKMALEYKIVGISIRQSLFLSLLIIMVLFLQSKSLLTWWNIILLIVGVSILEFLFLSTKRTI